MGFGGTVIGDVALDGFVPDGAPSGAPRATLDGDPGAGWYIGGAT